jgi:two-component system nitrate/nitrite response regulator NarP
MIGPRLTARQAAVAALLARGMSNRQIGTALNIKYGTVKSHVRAILDIVGVDNRTQAAVELSKEEWCRPN